MGEELLQMGVRQEEPLRVQEGVEWRAGTRGPVTGAEGDRVGVLLPVPTVRHPHLQISWPGHPPQQVTKSLARWSKTRGFSPPTLDKGYAEPGKTHTSLSESVVV